MFYTVYKITNTIDRKIYIGVHKTNNLDDGYMGSGKYLKTAQEKHGIENFEKEILKVFDNADDMFEMESQLVSIDFIKEKPNYNIKEGGFDHINSNEELRIKKNQKAMRIARENGIDEKSQLALKWLRENDPIWLKKRKKQCSAGMIKYYENHKGTFTGKTHSEETKKKIGKANSKLQKGTDNSQFGTMWIHSLKEKRSKKIKKDEFSEWESNGWIKGRKMKFF